MYKYPYGDSQQLNLDWIISKIKELEEAGLRLNLEKVSNALISLTYNTSTAYRRYDYAFLNGKLYRCLSDTSGAFDPAAWMEVRIGEDIPVLTRLLNAVDASLTTLQNRAVIHVQDKITGNNTLDNIVNHALAQITAGMTSYGKLFTFRTNNGTGSDPNEYFGNSRVCVICNFQENLFGCGLLLSDSYNNIAAFIRRNGVNTLYPIGDFQTEINNLNGAITSLDTQTNSVEWTPANGDTLLAFILANCTRTKLPFSFIKIGTNTVSDAPTDVQSKEFTGFVYGSGNRIFVQVCHYVNNSSAFFQRMLYQNSWASSSSWVKYDACHNETITPSYLNVSSNTYNIQKYGNLVAISTQNYSSVIDNTPSSGWTTLFTLPVGCRPLSVIRGLGINVADSNKLYNIRIVESNGNVQVGFVDGSENLQMVFNIAFIAN